MTIEYSKINLVIREDYPEKPPVKILQEYLTVVPGIGGCDMIQKRTNGEFKDRAFFLSANYDWVLGRDSIGELVLIPIAKDMPHE
jgi:hypothetical protein